MQRFGHKHTDDPRRRGLPRHRVRTTAKRRDPYRPEVISSNTSSFRPEDLYGSGAAQLRPARDTGLTLQTRQERRAAAAAKRRRQWVVVIIVAVVFVFTAGFVWMRSSQKEAAAQLARLGSLFTPTARKGEGRADTDTEKDSADLAAARTTEANPPSGQGQGQGQGPVIADTAPTPLVASYKKLRIRLPVAPEDLTEVAFHPANFNYAVELKTHLPEMKLAEAKKKHGTGRDISVQPAGDEALLVGSCLKMWRSGRHTAVMTSMDIGARAGTPVRSSVDGTVTSVRVYRYDNKVDDYEIHVACDEAPGIEMVMIHVAKPKVQTGDRVTAGVTPVAEVRNLAKYVRNQLASYTSKKDPGNHTHIQFNDTRKSSYKARQRELAAKNWYSSIK
ncbi:MAG: M23 family metallopeptidase [Actinomycetes bacterium]|jgi:murein DD-endopeptidase MepM/ murein hydrolase activator NlpD|nr:M23 family metallopeptidase [Actinomycetes bacterium]